MSDFPVNQKSTKARSNIIVELILIVPKSNLFKFNISNRVIKKIVTII